MSKNHEADPENLLVIFLLGTIGLSYIAIAGITGAGIIQEKILSAQSTPTPRIEATVTPVDNRNVKPVCFPGSIDPACNILFPPPEELP